MIKPGCLAISVTFLFDDDGRKVLVIIKAFLKGHASFWLV